MINVHARDLLTEAWNITRSKSKEGMYQALTERFGPFPIWFKDEKGDAVIFGVRDFDTSLMTKTFAPDSNGCAELVAEKPFHQLPWICVDVRLTRMVMSDGTVVQHSAKPREPLYVPA